MGEPLREFHNSVFLFSVESCHEVLSLHCPKPSVKSVYTQRLHVRGLGANEGNRAVLCLYAVAGSREQPLESRSTDAQGFSGTWTSEPDSHRESQKIWE